MTRRSKRPEHRPATVDGKAMQRGPRVQAVPAASVRAQSDPRIRVQLLGDTHDGIVSAAPWALCRLQPTPDEIIQRNQRPYSGGQPRKRGCLNFLSSVRRAFVAHGYGKPVVVHCERRASAAPSALSRSPPRGKQRLSRCRSSCPRNRREEDIVFAFSILTVCIDRVS